MDAYASTESQSQYISQLATELSKDNASPSEEGAPSSEGEEPGNFGRGNGLSSLKNAVITKHEFQLRNDENYGVFTLSDAISTSPPSQFTLPDEFPIHQQSYFSPENAHSDNNSEEFTSPRENQKSYNFTNSYSDFNLINGTPVSLHSSIESPPCSPPIASTPLRTQQMYPGLSSTPSHKSLPLLNASSPFPFSTAYFNPAAQSPMSSSTLSDSLPRLSVPKLSLLMLEGSPSMRAPPDSGRSTLTQSCPLPESLSIPSNPSPLAQFSSTEQKQSIHQPEPSSSLSPPAILPQPSHPLPIIHPSQSPNLSAKFPASSLRRLDILPTTSPTHSVKFILSPIAIQPAPQVEGEGGEGENSVPSTPTSCDAPEESLDSSREESSGGSDIDPEEERKKIILEILSTEESYVTYLRLIKMIYIWPLRDMLQTADPILSEAEITDLFANSETLLQVHITFLKQLRKRLRNYAPGVGVGDIFSEVGPYFRMYSTFVKCYFLKGLKLLRDLNANNKKFKAFALDAKAKCKRLDLSDLLLMPVQRLPRYVLLLESLIKKTPDTHADYALLRNALTLIKKVAGQVNLGTVDDSESLAVLLRIQEALGINAPKELVQPHRKLVRQATLPLLVDDGDQNMQTNVYLFNDLLLIVEDKTSNLLECVEISRIFVRKSAMISGHSWGFEIFNASWTRSFGLNSQDEEEQWVDTISKSIEVLTSLHPLHSAHRTQAMKDIHSTRKMSVGERASLFEHIATVQKNRNNVLPPLAQFNPVPSIEAPLTAHMMVEKMRLQQEDMMRENHFLFEKVESNPRMRRSNTVTEFFKRLSQSTPPAATIRIPRKNQIVKCGYLTKQGGFIKSWKRRWFIMGNGHLYYTPDHMSTEVLGQIPLKGTVLEVDHDNTIRPFCMILHTFSRSYYICADGEIGLDEWMVALSTYFMSIATYQKLNHVLPDLPANLK